MRNEAVKRLWTCYYGAWRKLPARLVQVRISRTAPEWWQPATRRWEPALAPNDFVWAVRDVPEWEERYLLQLDGLRMSGELQRIVDRLPEGAVLLCWEPSPIGCHRTTLGAYLAEKFDVAVAEYPLAGPGQWAGQAKRVLV